MIKIEKIEEYNRIYIPRETKNEISIVYLKDPWNGDVYGIVPHYIQTTDNYYIVDLGLKDYIENSGTYTIQLTNGNDEPFQTVDVVVNLGDELDLNSYVQHQPIEYFFFYPHTIRKGGTPIDSPYVQFTTLNGTTHTVNYNNGIIPRNAFRRNFGMYSAKLVGIKAIQQMAFYECTNLHKVEFIDCPENFYSIEQSVFEGCSNLESIVIPSSINGLGDFCFKGCTSMSSITLPNMMSLIGDSCFEGCTSLKEITVPYLRGGTVGEGVFAECSSLERVLLDDDLKYLSDWSFNLTSSLKQINLENIQTIRDEAFFATGLKSVIMPKCEEIGAYAFNESPNLEYVKIRDCGVIGEGAFLDCNNLTTIVLNAPINIDETAFEGCSKLNDITVCVPIGGIVEALTQNAAPKGVFRTYHDYLDFVSSNLPQGWTVEEISEPIDWEK